MTNTIKQVESKVKKTIEDYRLINKKEKIFVAYSGGKDSTVILYILKKLGYNVEALTINAFIGNYSKSNLNNAINFCKKQNIKLHQVSFRDEFGYSLCYLRNLINSKGYKIKSCTICGVLRRYLINKHCKRLNAKKVIMGHNLDDEAQSIMMNFFRGNLEICARLGPITGLIKSKLFIPRIKPLYFISEKEITEYSKETNFPVVYGECPCSSDSYRRSVKKLLNKLEKQNKDIKLNIVDNFLKILPKLKQKYKTIKKINNCKYCNEPCKTQICKSCQLISLIIEK